MTVGAMVIGDRIMITDKSSANRPLAPMIYLDTFLEIAFGGLERLAKDVLLVVHESFAVFAGKQNVIATV